MSRIACVLAATAALVGCPSPPPKHPLPERRDDRPVRIRIAGDEARRGDGLRDLVDLATHGARDERILALRGLGRVGGAPAIEVVRAALADPDSGVVAAAAGALGVTALLDEPPPTDDLGADLERALGTVAAADKPVVIEAIGRAATTSSEPVLAVQLRSPVPAIAEAAALACGRFGRRKLALAADTRIALAELTARPEPSVRLAAVYAFAREHIPATPVSMPALGPRLVARVADELAETRMQAIVALERQGLVTAAHRELEGALLDRDFRVAAAAITVLAGKTGDDAGRDAVAAALVRRYAELERGAPSEAHVVLAGLEALEAYGARPLVTAAATAIAAQAAAATALSPLTRGWIECRAQMVLAHGAPSADLVAFAGCGHGSLPDPLRLPLVGELIKDKIGTLAARRTALGALLVHPDVRVRAAGLDALASLWSEGDAADHHAMIATLVAAIASNDLIVAGSAIDAAGAVYEASGANDPALDAALLARAPVAAEPELAASIFELIGKRKLAGGAEVCRAGLTGNPVRTKAARSCLSAMGEPATGIPIGPASVPPVDVASVIARRLRWHLLTSKGEVVIALRPDVAPWAVATIVALTRKGFYDGLAFHRVVPGFVVQGGDPTMSGWGGPGFATPSEPGSIADGPGFMAGGVGMADSGRDTGGSQWFIMHARFPHLDGRYTWVGTVDGGQKSADALLIGDLIEHATIEDATPQ